MICFVMYRLLWWVLHWTMFWLLHWFPEKCPEKTCIHMHFCTFWFLVRGFAHCRHHLTLSCTWVSRGHNSVGSLIPWCARCRELRDHVLKNSTLEEFCSGIGSRARFIVRAAELRVGRNFASFEDRVVRFYPKAVSSRVTREHQTAAPLFHVSYS